MTKTNLFLIGAAKAGTTALAEMLGNHPEISPLAIKEPGHFCDDIYAEGFSTSYQKMLRWDEAQYFKAEALGQRTWPLLGDVKTMTDWSQRLPMLSTF
jgi:hypothetical protein